MHLNGGKLSKYLKKKWANGLKIYDFEKNLDRGAALTPPRGNIHVNHHDFQRPMTLLGQSKPNLI